MSAVKGTVDYDADDWAKLKFIMDVIRSNATTLDVEEIDTPVIESTKLLLGKYGEEAETKQIFKLDGDKNSLRYDLTVPFTRYITGRGIDNIRRFQIGKVFRKDRPAIANGRFREFYQADVDLVGEYEPLASEGELFYLINKVLTDLGISEYVIRYNYRDNLYSICEKAGITDSADQKCVCTTLDKLDKMSWDEVITELVELRGLTEEQVTILQSCVLENSIDNSLVEYDSKLNELCENLTFDASLARGLDYYTGIIYEVTVPNTPVKTIIAGGRYDELIYKSSKKKRRYIPAIGVSFGISRIKLLVDLPIQDASKVFVISKDIRIRLKLLEYYRRLGLRASYDRTNRKTLKQITFAVRNNYSLVVIYGEDDNFVRVKELLNSDPDKLCELDSFDYNFAR